MKIRSKTLGTIIAIGIFGGILGASAMGLWKTETVRSPNSVQRNQSIDEVTGENVETGEFLPADIRGNHRFGEISEIFDIPLEILGHAFALPSNIDPADFNNQDFESIYPHFEVEQEIGNGSIKWFVALYTGLPFEFEDDEEATYLLRPAVEILMNHADLTAEQIAYLDAHMIEIEFEQVDYNIPEDDLQTSAEADGDEEETVLKQDEMVVAGKTTFADLLDWGVSTEEIETIIGGEILNRLISVYDHCADNGLPFGQIKRELQVEVDKLGS
ncbi:MAG: hypothetical protein HQ574_02355 [Chloroflexi bacterium]|nr:hypothetical protein [Chloroflexota bacterium]